MKNFAKAALLITLSGLASTAWANRCDELTKSYPEAICEGKSQMAIRLYTELNQTRPPSFENILKREPLLRPRAGRLLPDASVAGIGYVAYNVNSSVLDQEGELNPDFLCPELLESYNTGNVFATPIYLCSNRSFRVFVGAASSPPVTDWYIVRIYRYMVVESSQSNIAKIYLEPTNYFFSKNLY